MIVSPTPMRPKSSSASLKRRRGPVALAVITERRGGGGGWREGVWRVRVRVSVDEGRWLWP